MFAAYHEKNQTANEIIPACALLIANGGFLLVFSTRRYLQVVSALRQDRFLVDTRGTLAAVFLTAVSTVTSLSLALQVQLRSTTRNEKDESKETRQ